MTSTEFTLFHGMIFSKFSSSHHEIMVEGDAAGLQ